jgi:hypothetical protein
MNVLHGHPAPPDPARERKLRGGASPPPPTPATDDGKKTRFSHICSSSLDLESASWPLIVLVIVTSTISGI